MCYFLNFHLFVSFLCYSVETSFVFLWFDIGCLYYELGNLVVRFSFKQDQILEKKLLLVSTLYYASSFK